MRKDVAAPDHGKVERRIHTNFRSLIPFSLRVGDAAWERHLASGAKLLKPEEVWRELGV